ncbi:MAG: hypothetical protein DWQ01_00590 [Planctomycetota bacterium]|nr:MAG: hypothetical protein DWQ01_00590 [Planctomycetota bacterium]
MSCRQASWFKRIALLALAFKPELIDGRYRTFKAFYRDLKVGMNRSEVEQLIDRYYSLDSGRLRPTVMKDIGFELGFFMNPEDASRPNCEGIFLSFQEGRVTRKHDSRD